MGRKLALIVGNSHYDDPGLARLQAPLADVHALADVLRDPAIAAFDEVQALVDESFARARRSIARFFDERKRDDLLLLYFSGHGVRDDFGHLHLAVRDTERELLSATAIEASFITACMDRSASRRLLLVLDCCHSGAFAAGSKSVQGASVGTATVFEGNGRGRVVLTATDSTQYAWEGDAVVGSAGASVFTRHLTDGLRTGAADLNRDGLITVDELYDYVYDRVLDETAKQTPGKWAFGQQGDIVVARTAGVAAGSAAVYARPSRQRSRAIPPRTMMAAAAVIVVPASLMIAQFMSNRPDDPSLVEAPPSTATAAPPAAAAPPANAETPASSPAPAPAMTPPQAAAPTSASARAPAAPAPLTVKTATTAPTAREEPPAAAPAPAATPAAPLVDLRTLFPPATSERPTIRSTPAPAAAPPAASKPEIAAAPSPPAALAAHAIVEYERAMEALDFDRLRRVWPRAPDALRRAFQNLTSQAVDLDSCVPDVLRDGSSVTCEERVQSVGAGGITLPPVTNTVVFDVRRVGDAWQIEQIARKPR